MKILFILALLVNATLAIGQSFTSYFTGNPQDTVVYPLGGICLMGGSTESDEAMQWFLRKANDGDVLVLRASGSDGYNDYLYAELGVPVNSVETIVFHDAEAAYDPYVHQRISQAEAIWFAGGNQWNYVQYWRNTPVDSLINDAINNKKVAVGGTSAGMAILGQYYFSAQNGTVTSAAALADPYDPKVTVDALPFLRVNHLQKIITDTHFSNRKRQGRLLTFLARILVDYGVEALGIACDERTALCIDPGGRASVFGEDPDYDNHAYFIQTNCALTNRHPESSSAGTPLTWDLAGTAIRVYKVKGTKKGSGAFDLNTWQEVAGGGWEYWSVNNGGLTVITGAPVNCVPLPGGN